MQIRRFALDDAQATRDVFVAAVQIGAAGRYSEQELAEWLPDPAMPDDWGTWLDCHITFVAQDSDRITGFMMVEADGYLNMAFVLPEVMGKGVADALYVAILAEARARQMPRLRVLASRYASSFFARQGWVTLPEDRPDLPDPPMNCQMALEL